MKCDVCQQETSAMNIPPTATCYACTDPISTCSGCGQHLYLVHVSTQRPIHADCMAMHPSISDDDLFRFPSRIQGGRV